MPNRPALRRGGPREQAALAALRVGLTRQAAAAAAGVSRRTFYRAMERSPAFAHDVALAEDEAEAAMTNVVWEAAQAGDVKAAMFWLERRRPADYRLQQQVDGRLAVEQEYPPEVLAITRRYAAMDDAEVLAEIKRLGWVDESSRAGAMVGQITTADQIVGREQPVNGDGPAMLLPPSLPLRRDKAANVAADPGAGTDMPRPSLTADMGRNGACPHCIGLAPDGHDLACPVFEPDGRLREVPPMLAFGDPR